MLVRRSFTRRWNVLWIAAFSFSKRDNVPWWQAIRLPLNSPEIHLTVFSGHRKNYYIKYTMDRLKGHCSLLKPIHTLEELYPWKVIAVSVTNTNVFGITAKKAR